MSWSFSWNGQGTDFDPEFVSAAAGGSVSATLVEAAREVVQDIKAPVSVSGYGHTTFNEQGELVSGTTAVINIAVLAVVPPAEPVDSSAPSGDAPQAPADPEPADATTPGSEGSTEAEGAPQDADVTPAAPEAAAQAEPAPSEEPVAAPAPDDAQEV